MTTVEQTLLLLPDLAFFIALHSFPKRAPSRFRTYSTATSQSRRQFIVGAQILTRTANHATLTRSAPPVTPPTAPSPLTPATAPPILGALALDLQGLHKPALRTLDAILSTPADKSLSPSEHGDALLKRVKIHLAINLRRRSEQALVDLNESVQLSPENEKTFCLLDDCYEHKGVAEDIRRAFESTLKIDASLSPVREGLQRLSVASSSS